MLLTNNKSQCCLVFTLTAILCCKQEGATEGFFALWGKFASTQFYNIKPKSLLFIFIIVKPMLQVYNPYVESINLLQYVPTLNIDLGLHIQYIVHIFLSGSRLKESVGQFYLFTFNSEL